MIAPASLPPVAPVPAPPGVMHKYRITIVMPDGSRGAAWGQFANDWDAIDTTIDAFSDAKRISARRLS